MSGQPPQASRKGNVKDIHQENPITDHHRMKNATAAFLPTDNKGDMTDN